MTTSALEQALAVTASRLVRQRAARGFVHGLARGAMLLPAMALAGALGWFAGSYIAHGAPFPAWALPLVILVVPLAAACAFALRCARAPLSSYDAALACDRAQATQDRLSAAVELGPNAARDPFCRAVREDAEAFLARVDPRRADERWPRPAWPIRAVVLGLLLACIPLLAPVLPESHAVPATTPRADARLEPSEEPARSRTASAPSSSTERTASRLAAGRAEKQPASAPQARRETPKGSGGAAPAGSASEQVAAAPSERASAAAQEGAAARAQGGLGEGGASANKGGAQKEPEAKPTPKKPPRTARPTPRDQKGQPNESSSPAGSSRTGGQRSALADQRDAKDLGREARDEESPPEEEIEEDDEQSEQRGGVMPLTRDRQQPPSRELSISGNGPPDDGRGGPTPPKKSRGVAALVLGIRLPDHVHGRPNPGTTKQNLASSPPRAENRPRAAALASLGTTDPTPQSPSPPPDRLTPLVLRYHELLRATAAKEK